MNAYELADINDWSCCAHVKEVSAMLRQQADRIAHLEMLVSNRNEIIDKLDLTMAQIKELSDEEIKDFIATFPIIFTPDDLLSFARAILKKASEK